MSKNSPDRALPCTDCIELFIAFFSGTAHGKCKICSSDCHSIKLTENLKPEVQDFFSEPDEIVARLIKVLEFQKQHRTRLTGHWISLNRKYKEVKAEVKKLTLVSQKMYEELREMHKQNKMLKTALQARSNNGHSALYNKKVRSPPSICTPTQYSRNQSNRGHPPNNAKFMNVFQSTLVTPLRINKMSGSNTSLAAKKCGHMSGHDRGYKEQSLFLTPPSDKCGTPGSGYFSASPNDFHPMG